MFFFALLAIVCGYAFIRGKLAERAMASIFLTGLALSMLSVSPVVHRYAQLEIWLWLVDTAMLLAMLVLTVRFPTRPLALIVALQLVIVLMHVAKIVDPVSFRETYKIALAFWSYPQLLLLAFETSRTARRARAAVNAH